jgi:prepilin-type processing-associated H-X9-DG protein
MKTQTSPFTKLRPGIRGISVFQVLIVLGVITVLLAIAFPIYSSVRKKAHKQVALDKVRMLGEAILTYANQNNGDLPDEDAPGKLTWSDIADAKAKNAWFNVLPKQLGKKSAADYAETHELFYTDENILFLPGANYPDKKKFGTPMFAIAMNTKLERTEPDGKVARAKLSDIGNPGRTVSFLEQGLLNENTTLDIQTKKDYDGAPKGSAKSFVGRYDNQGVLAFFDGHVELAPVKNVLDETTGKFPFPQTNVIWTAKAEDDPNKSAADKAREKKEKK